MKDYLFGLRARLGGERRFLHLLKFNLHQFDILTHMFGKVNPVTLEQHFCQLTRVYP